jgi:hypothetical protein
MFEKNFMLGAATAAHQVEGNNVNSDCWALEHIAHSSYDEPSGAAVDHYHHFRKILICWQKQDSTATVSLWNGRESSRRKAALMRQRLNITDRFCVIAMKKM